MSKMMNDGRGLGHETKGTGRNPDEGYEATVPIKDFGTFKRVPYTQDEIKNLKPKGKFSPRMFLDPATMSPEAKRYRELFEKGNLGGTLNDQEKADLESYRTKYDKMFQDEATRRKFSEPNQWNIESEEAHELTRNVPVGAAGYSVKYGQNNIQSYLAGAKQGNDAHNANLIRQHLNYARPANADTPVFGSGAGQYSEGLGLKLLKHFQENPGSFKNYRQVTDSTRTLYGSHGNQTSEQRARMEADASGQDNMGAAQRAKGAASYQERMSPFTEAWKQDVYKNAKTASDSATVRNDFKNARIPGRFMDSLSASDPKKYPKQGK